MRKEGGRPEIKEDREGGWIERNEGQTGRMDTKRTESGQRAEEKGRTKRKEGTEGQSRRCDSKQIERMDREEGHIYR